MTPTAVTPAARAKRATPARPASPHPSAPRSVHRTPLRRATGQVGSVPRRVSGPARPADPPRTARTAPAARPTSPAPRVRRAPQVADALHQPLGARLAGLVRTLPDHALLDRIVRGRLWIPLLGVLLVGIVAMQVEVLKLNAGIGHAMVRTAQLQSQDQRLRDAVSQLSDDQRIMADAAQMDMSMPLPSTPKFLAGGKGSDLSRALANIHSPDPTGFAARTSAAEAAAAASTTSVQ
jgi:hypothetical protein